jgi:hypothetical protein
MRVPTPAAGTMDQIAPETAKRKKTADQFSMPT